MISPYTTFDNSSWINLNPDLLLDPSIWDIPKLNLHYIL